MSNRKCIAVIHAVRVYSRFIGLTTGSKLEALIYIFEHASQLQTEKLDSARCCSMLLDAARFCSMLLGAARCCSMLLDFFDAVWCCLMLFDATRFYSMLLNAARFLSMLLDAARCHASLFNFFWFHSHGLQCWLFLASLHLPDCLLLMRDWCVIGAMQMIDWAVVMAWFCRNLTCVCHCRNSSSRRIDVYDVPHAYPFIKYDDDTYVSGSRLCVKKITYRWLLAVSRRLADGCWVVHIYYITDSWICECIVVAERLHADDQCGRYVLKVFPWWRLTTATQCFNSGLNKLFILN